MGLFGKLIKTGFDVVALPIAVVKDAMPGCGGYIDGNASHTREKTEKLSEDVSEVRETLEDL